MEHDSKLQLATFYVLLALAILVVAVMWWPFVKILAFAVILTILFTPVYQKILKWVKRPSLASLLTILIILLIVVIPLSLIGVAVFNEVVSLYSRYSHQSFSILPGNALGRLSPQVQHAIQNLDSGLSQKITDITNNAFSSLSGLISNVLGFLITVFLLFFSVYYLLKDGQKFKEFMGSILPLSEKHENVLINRLERAISGVIKGSFLTSLSQGVASTIGFSIFGVPQPFLWAIFVVIAALVPTVGTTISLGSAVVYLLLEGHVGSAVGLAIWSIVFIGLIDNVLSPKFISTGTELHPLLILVSVLGGIELFGLLGFLLGPVIVAVLVALLEIYRTDLRVEDKI